MSDKASRLLRIYSRLRRGPVTIEIIKQWAKNNDIQVSERSLYRDLKEIEQSINLEGESIVVSEGEKNKKVWKIEYNKSNNGLNEFDITSFLLFRNFAPLVLVTARQKSLEKIENLFYTSYSKSKFENLAALAEMQIASSHFYGFTHSDEYENILQDCIWSIQNKRELKINAIRFDVTSIATSVIFPITLMPLQILYHRGNVHVCGFIKKTNKLIVIALQQIQSYELTNEMFDSHKYFALFGQEMRNRFGITENMDEKVYKIELEFSEQTGNFVSNHYWHPSQQFIHLPNGNYLMKLQCGINRELVGWIFQWMSNVKVIKPKKLSTLLKVMITNVANLYAQPISLNSNNIFRPL